MTMSAVPARRRQELGVRKQMAPSVALYLRFGGWGAMILCVLAQVFIDPSYVNICAVLLAATSAVIVISYLFRDGVFSKTPISSLMVFGLNFTLLSGPIVFQTLDWRSFVFNLDVPFKTIGIAVSVSVLAALTHFIYRHSILISKARYSFSTRVLSWFGVFRPPSNLQLWLMGLIGLTVMWFTGTAEARAGIEFGNVGGKFFQSLAPFAVAPFLIPAAGALFRPESRYAPVPWLMLGGYFLLVLGVALASNSRSDFASVLLVLGLCLLLAALVRDFRVRTKSVVVAAIVVAMGIPLLGVFSDVSTAMLVSRSLRDEASAPELVRRTIEAMGDRQALELYRNKSQLISSGYNETYISNNFFQRLTLLKFLDLTLKNTARLSEDQRAFARESFVKRLTVLLPTPIISALGLQVDKRDYLYSGGDLYRFLASGGRLAGFVTGSAIADGLVLMGIFFWPACVLFFGVSFFLFDAYVLPIRTFGIVISPVVLMILDRLLMLGLNGESVAGVLGQIVRAYPQSLLLYSAMFFMTLGVSFLFDRLPGKVEGAVAPGRWDVRPRR